MFYEKDGDDMEKILAKIEKKIYSAKASCDIAYLKPVVSLNSNGNMDSFDSQRRKDIFPRTGQIFLRKAPPDVEENFWVWITVKEEPSDKPCQIAVDELISTSEECRVLNLPSSTLEAVIDHLNKEGLDALSTPNVYLRFLSKENECLYLHLEKMKMREKEDKNAWFCNDNMREKVFVYSINETDILDITDEGRNRVFLRPGVNPLFKETVNIQSSEEVLKSLLKRARELDSSFVEAMNVTQKLYDGYRQKLLPSSALETEAFRTRVKAVLNNIGENQKYLQELLQLHYERNSEVLKNMCQQEMEEELRQRKEVFEEELAQKRETLEKDLSQRKEVLEGEISDLQKEKNEVEVLIQEQQEKLDQHAAIFKDKIKSVVSDAFGIVAESSIYKLMLGNDLWCQNRMLPTSSEVCLPEKDRDSTSMSREDFSNEVGALLNANCAFGDEDTHDAIAGAIALVASRRLPVFWGTGAIPAMEALGTTLCAGIIIWYSISAATYKTQDLLGQMTGDGKFIPSPPNLQALLQKAEKCDHLILVALEGINRSPVEAYLPFLLAAYKNKRIKIPVWQGEDITWPSNVLLAASLVEGESTFPIPRFLQGENLMLLPAKLGANGSNEGRKYRDFLLEDWLDLSERVVDEPFDKQLPFVSKRLNLHLGSGLEQIWNEKSQKFFWNPKE